MAKTSDLLNAVVSGNTEQVRKLVLQNHGCASARDAQGVSALMHAIYRRQNDAIAILLNAHSQLDIFEAASVGRTERIKELIAQSPALVNAYSADGFTALHFAAYFVQPAAASLLIGHGANVTAVAKNATEVMPIHSAASSRNIAVLRELLKNGAPVDARQQGGWTALHAAAQNGDIETIEALLEHGADPAASNNDGKTAADLAREKGHQQIVDRLATLMS